MDEKQQPTTTTKRERGSGRIFQRGKLLWIAYSLRGQEFRESAKTDDPKKVERFLKHRMKQVGADQIGAKTFVTPQSLRITVNELLDNLQTDKRLRGKGKIETLLKPLRLHFGQMRASELTAGQVDDYIENLCAQDYTRAAINRRTQVLGQAYRLAIRQKQLGEMPLIRRMSELGNTRKGFTSRQTVDRVLANLRDQTGRQQDDLGDMVLFAFLSSWRRGEILSLTWDNVTPDAIRLSAEHSKEREARSLALEGELAEIIERRRVKANGPLVFHRAGRSVVDFGKAWRTATRLAGVPKLLFHDLRRSGVRDMIRAGVAPHVAMSVSGHKTDSMLRRYAIISEADQREALRRTAEFRKAEIESAPQVSRVVQ